MKVAKDKVVSIHYKLATADGKEVDNSDGGDPLEYLHGHGNIVAGLEKALAGKAAGDHVSVVVKPDEGYGAYDEELDIRVPKDVFPGDMWSKLRPGMSFVAEHPTKEGEDLEFRVLSMQGDSAMLSGNHPLAGETLTFEVDVVAIRKATDDEIERGHLHSHSCEGGCGGCGGHE